MQEDNFKMNKEL